MMEIDTTTVWGRIAWTKKKLHESEERYERMIGHGAPPIHCVNERSLQDRLRAHLARLEALIEDE